MVELADTPDLGSGSQECRFKSCYPHEINIIRTHLQLMMGPDYFFGNQRLDADCVPCKIFRFFK